GPVRISNAAGASELPCLLAGPNRNLHLAWVDSRDGNQEIYYREYIDPANGTGGEDTDPLLPPNIGPVITSSPNPFSASTNVELSVPDACTASIRIYDVTGRCVRNLLSGSVSSGTHAVAWDGTDGAGRALAPGVYFALGRAGKMRIERKILLIR
ncbi:MAG: FlgD immunoglobulin-like domain containing protein, partial [Candidatus Krumholzibacteriia bacterium]